jgi:phosphoglycolate phosphatase-like HAD superfamily hydrolase
VEALRPARKCNSKVKLILFDIDGTLIDSGGAGVRSLNLAFQDLFSIPDAFSAIAMAGKTDTQIIREGLVAWGLPPGDGVIPRVIVIYLSHLLDEVHNDRRHLKNGVIELLAALSEEADRVHLGLLTGNIERGARIKLDPFGLNAYFPFGAFGDDEEDRNKLLPVAVQRYHALYGREIDFPGCVIVGDTPRDVECAKRFGAACIAVATGPYGIDQLAQSGADRVLEDLTDLGAILEALA